MSLTIRYNANSYPVSVISTFCPVQISALYVKFGVSYTIKYVHRCT